MGNNFFKNSPHATNYKFAHQSLMESVAESLEDT